MSKTPSSDDEGKIIKALITESDSNSKPGDAFFLIHLKWWNRWKEYVNYSEKGTTASRPDSIDNSELLDHHGVLKPLQMEGNNYALLPASCWAQLQIW